MTGATSTVAERRSEVSSWLPVHAWPDREILLAAVDVDLGERRVFDRSSGVSLIDAVQASGALAGVYPALEIDGRRHVDGGFYSTDNADLAAGCNVVLLLALKSGNPPMCVVTLDTAVEGLRAKGARVEIVHPDSATEAAFADVGGNILDPAIRGKAADAGRAQGRAIVGGLARFWS